MTYPRSFTEPTSFRCETCTGIWQAQPHEEIDRPVCTGQRHGQRHGMTHMRRLPAAESADVKPTVGLEVAA